MPRNPLSRDVLARFLPNHEAILAFEQALGDVNATPSRIEEVNNVAGTAIATAYEVLAQLIQVSEALSQLLQAPTVAPLLELDDLIPPRQPASNDDDFAPLVYVGTLGVQAADDVDIDGGTIDGTVIGGDTPESGTFTDLTAQDGADISGTVAIDNTANTLQTVMAGRNQSAGNAAVCRASLGNDDLVEAFTIDAYGSNHATKPNNVEMINQGPGNLVLGTNGADAIDINSSNEATFTEPATFNDGVTVAGEVEVNNAANTTLNNYTGRNTSAGNAAVARASYGNDATADLLTIDVFGSNHATLPNYAQIYTQTATVLRLGTNNTTALTIDASQAVSVANSFTASTGFGCNGKTAQTAYALGGAATDLATALTLVNNLRLMSIANGIGQN